MPNNFRTHRSSVLDSSSLSRAAGKDIYQIFTGASCHGTVGLTARAEKSAAPARFDTEPTPSHSSTGMQLLTGRYSVSRLRITGKSTNRGVCNDHGLPRDTHSTLQCIILR